MSRIWIAVIVMLVLAAGVFWYTWFSVEGVPPQESTATSTSKEVVSTTTNSVATSTSVSISTKLVDDVVLTAASTDVSQGEWKKTIATVFWAGEGADEDNGYITNVESAWDEDWMPHFGGVDDSDDRCGFNPCAFTPKENPFYVALPYNDLDDDGDTKVNAKRVPWYRESEKSILKNRWIAVRTGGKVCYGQWEDVGPFYEDDIEYVFGGTAKPLNTEGEKAGIDLSPAMRDCLGVDGSSNVEWRHVAEGDVPHGPWKNIITTRLSQ